MSNINFKTPQLTVVKRLFDAYCALNSKTALPLLAKDFKAQCFPKSPKLPVEAREEHVEKWGAIQSHFTNVEIVAHEVIEAPGKVVSQFTIKNIGFDGTPLDYDTVMIHTLVEEDGELKIVEQKDFANPEQREKLYSWITKAIAQKAA